MKSIISSVVLVVLLSFGSSLLAQGRGRGNGTGSPAVQSRPAPAAGQHPNVDHSRNDKDTATTAHIDHPRRDADKHISDNPTLASKLQTLLPAGTNMDAAASGFKNKGQFIAAAHVSHNLNIPFDQLKARMVTDHMSLGEAIHSLKPDMSKTAANTEAKKAQEEAKKDGKS